MRNYADWVFCQEKMKAKVDNSPPDQRRFEGEGQRELLAPNKKSHSPKDFYGIRHSYTKTAMLRSCRLAWYQRFRIVIIQSMMPE